MKIDVHIVSMHGASAGASGVRDMPGGTRIDQALALLDLPPDEPCAVLCNDMPVAPDVRAETVLNDGDKLTIFPPIKGG